MTDEFENDRKIINAATLGKWFAYLSEHCGPTIQIMAIGGRFGKVDAIPSRRQPVGFHREAGAIDVSVHHRAETGVCGGGRCGISLIGDRHDLL